MRTSTDSQSYGYGGASASAGGPGSLSRSISAAGRSSLESQIELIDSSGDDERVGNSNALVLPLQLTQLLPKLALKKETEMGMQPCNMRIWYRYESYYFNVVSLE